MTPEKRNISSSWIFLRVWTNAWQGKKNINCFVLRIHDNICEEVKISMMNNACLLHTLSVGAGGPMNGSCVVVLMGHSMTLSHGLAFCRQQFCTWSSWTNHQICWEFWSWPPLSVQVNNPLFDFIWRTKSVECVIPWLSNQLRTSSLHLFHVASCWSFWILASHRPHKVVL